MQWSKALDMYALTTVLIVIFTGPTVSAYPYAVRQRKADPFVALASTLRQQDQLDQRPRQPMDGAGDPAAVGPYAYDDYGAQRGPSEDDLWRLEQLQRQLGHAAMMPFYASARPQRSWGNVVEGPDDLGTGPIEYGIPVAEEVDAMDSGRLLAADADDGGMWYEDTAPEQVEYVPSQSNEDQQERQKQEAELLLNTLAEYMLLYDSEKGQFQEESKRANSAELQQNDESGTSAQTTASAALAATDAPAASQPPVEKDADGTPMGQKEFPMMRPANLQRKQWMATQGKLDFTDKRHGKSKSQIVTSEDRLMQELDSLKAKKN